MSNTDRFLKNTNKWLNSFEAPKLYRVGIDTGVGSLGLAIIQDDKYGNPIKILAAHSITFSKGVIPKSGATKNSKCRGYRSSNRRINRTKNRKLRINWLFQDNHLLTRQQEAKARIANTNIYQLRTRGIDHQITLAELYRIVYFFAMNRGFKQIKAHSSADGKLLKSLGNTDKFLNKSLYRTVGEMLYKSPRFKNMKRNRRGNYNCSISREQVIAELKMILDEQSKHYSKINSRFITQCLHIISYQRTFDQGVSAPSQYAGGILNKIGLDELDKQSYVAPKASATFEYFRMLENLNNLRYFRHDHWTSLDTKQRNIVNKLRFKLQSISYKRLAKALGISTKFNNANKKSFAKFKATYQIGKCIDNVYDTRLIDQIGWILSLYSNPRILREHLSQLKLSKLCTNKLMKLAAKNSFSSFSSLSFKSMHKLIPYLKKGMDLYDAELKASLIVRHPKARPLTLDDLKYMERTYTNPVQIRSIHVIFKALRAVINKLGKPDYIFIEDGHEISHTKKERVQIQAHQHKYAKENKKISAYLKRHHHYDNFMNRLDYKLYMRQHGRDLYPPCQRLTMHKIFDGSNYTQIDHSQPLGISWNNSFNNLVLTTAKNNQKKGQRTVLQWLGTDTKAGKEFIKYVNKVFPKWAPIKGKYRKVTKKVNGKRTKIKEPKYKPINIGIRANLLRVVPNQAVHNWQPRDLSNNQTIADWLANFLREHMHYRTNPYLNKQRTYVSTGMTTSLLRHAWHIKKVRKVSDEHHAVDAVVIAMTSPALREKVSRFYKRWSKLGYRPKFPEPYKGFINDVKQLKNKISMRRLAWKNKTPKIIKDSKYSGKYLKQGLVMQHRPVIDLKRKIDKKTGKPVIGYNAYAWRYRISPTSKSLFKALDQALAKHSNSGKKAFPDGYLKTSNHIVYKVPLFKKFKHGIYSKKYNCVCPHASIACVLMFSKGHKLYPVKVYPIQWYRHEIPTIKRQYARQGYHFCFKLNNFDPIKIIFKRNKSMKFGDRNIKSNHFEGCYRRISGNSLLVQPFDLTSQGQAFTGIGMSIIKDIKKLQPTDFFGDNYNEI